MKPAVLVICGPTATGKTSLAVSLAKRLNTEVISADCMLVYKGLNIGTAKPTLEEMDGVVHHMIDIVEPTEKFSVSDYEDLALPIVVDLLSKGKIPIVCGGTGFYINSLLFKQKFGGTAANVEIRKKYEQIEKEKGREYLHSLLEKVDPESAEKLHCNDVKRVVRALEIFELTGEKKSSQKDELIPRFPYYAFSYDYPREELYSRVERRVDIMFEQGLLSEVESLLKNGVPENAQSMQGIGYKETVELVKNPNLQSTVSDIIKKNTRNYAKRQVTFFKKLPEIKFLSPYDKNNEDKILEYLCND